MLSNGTKDKAEIQRDTEIRWEMPSDAEICRETLGDTKRDREVARRIERGTFIDMSGIFSGQHLLNYKKLKYEDWRMITNLNIDYSSDNITILQDFI